MKYGKFTKYSGAKDRIFNEIIPEIGFVKRNYFEPFLGAGSVFFELMSRGLLSHAGEFYLSDLNPDVIAMHMTVRDDARRLIIALERISADYNALDYDSQSDFYYALRDRFNETIGGRGTIDRTAMFIALLRLAFNGVIRYGPRGNFNTSWSKRRSLNFFTEKTTVSVFLADSSALSDPRVHLEVLDFQRSVVRAHPGDTAYLDPPYFNTGSDLPGFYTVKGFPKKDQDRLFEVCKALDANGVKWVQDNSDDPYIRQLYCKKSFFEPELAHFKCRTIHTTRTGSRNIDERADKTEIVITNTANLEKKVKHLPGQKGLYQYGKDYFEDNTTPRPCGGEYAVPGPLKHNRDFLYCKHPGPKSRLKYLPCDLTTYERWCPVLVTIEI